MASTDNNLTVYLTNTLSWEKYGGFKAPITPSVSCAGNGLLVLALTKDQQNGLCLRFTPPEKHEWFLLFYDENDTLVAKEAIPYTQLALCLHPFGPISAQVTVQDKQIWRSKVSTVLKNWKDYPLDSSEWSNSDESRVVSVDAFMASINAKAKRKRTTKKSNPSSSSKDTPF